MSTTVADMLEQRCDQLTRNCLTRIRDLRSLLGDIEKKLRRGGELNDLGELQGVAVILDCRLASLATLEQFQRDLQKAEKESS